MIANYEIQVRKVVFSERTETIIKERFCNSEEYSMRIAELMIRLSQKKEERFRILAYKNDHLIKCITIENLKEK